MLATRNTKIGQSFLKRPAEGYRVPSGWLGPVPSYPTLKVDSGAGLEQPRARPLVRVGNDREKLDKAASELSGRK